MLRCHFFGHILACFSLGRSKVFITNKANADNPLITKHCRLKLQEIVIYIHPFEIITTLREGSSDRGCLNPDTHQREASSIMAVISWAGDCTLPLNVLEFLSFHNIQPIRKKRGSKPRRRGFGTCFRAWEPPLQRMAILHGNLHRQASRTSLLCCHQLVLHLDSFVLLAVGPSTLGSRWATTNGWEGERRASWPRTYRARFFYSSWRSDTLLIDL